MLYYMGGMGFCAANAVPPLLYILIRTDYRGRYLAVIEFKNVSKTYKNGTEALKNVNIRIEDGEFVFIVGSSGAAKHVFEDHHARRGATTAVRCISTALT